jgi:DNA-binding PucR family transcriptional regulator
LGQLIFQRIKFCYGFVKGFFVVGFYSQFQQAGDIFQALAHLIKRINDGLKGGTLFTQRLRAFGFVPYVRLFQLGVYFFQTLFLGIIVKDTP